MSVLDKKTRADGIRLITFMLVTTLATGVLVVLIGNLSFGATRTYQAVFADATGLVKGSDVRIAGVKVGSVKDVEVTRRTRALVTFKVEKKAIITRSSTAMIRYRDLLGGRYISMSQGVGSTAMLPEDSTIPLKRTQSALDLTVLFNGFKPLFAALTPADVNKLSAEIIAVFQGEGSNVEGLLADTSAVTQTLASRDKVIGELIDNLNQVLVTVGSRDRQLTSLITQLQRFVGGLKDDRKDILGSLDGISNLAQQTAGLTRGIRPSFAADVKQLRRLTKTLDKGEPQIDSALQILPIKLNKIGRTAIYGSFFNFYICSLKGNVVLPGGTQVPITYNTPQGRCRLG